MFLPIASKLLNKIEASYTSRAFYCAIFGILKVLKKVVFDMRHLKKRPVWVPTGFDSIQTTWEPLKPFFYKNLTKFHQQKQRILRLMDGQVKSYY